MSSHSHDVIHLPFLSGFTGVTVWYEHFVKQIGAVQTFSYKENTAAGLLTDAHRPPTKHTPGWGPPGLKVLQVLDMWTNHVIHGEIWHTQALKAWRSPPLVYTLVLSTCTEGQLWEGCPLTMIGVDTIITAVSVQGVTLQGNEKQTRTFCAGLVYILPNTHCRM